MDTPYLKKVSFLSSGLLALLIVLQVTILRDAINGTTLTLFILLLASLYIPEFLPSVTKLKIGNVEFERELRDFGEQIYRAREHLESHDLMISSDVPELKLKILKEADTNPENAILVLCNQMEIIMRSKLGDDLALQWSLGKSIKEAVDRGIISPDCQGAYERWWQLKSKIRNLNFRVSKETMVTMLSYGLVLLDMIASRPKEQSNQSGEDNA